VATRKAWKTGRLVALVGIIIVLGLASLGCVRGLAPIGWSGGAEQNGKIFVGARDGTLTAITVDDLSRQKGEVLTGKSQGGLFGCSAVYGGGCSSGSSAVAIYGTPAFAADLVYIAGYNGRVYAYNTENLAVRWVYPRDAFLEPIVGSVVTDGARLYFGDSSGTVYALDATTGDLVWSQTTGDKVWGTAAVVDGTVYIGSFDKKLYALDAADGTVKWTFEAGGSFIATPVVRDGVVYVGAFDRSFYALDAATGTEKWSFRAGNWFWSKPVIVNDVIYAPSLDGNVYALRPDGALLTKYDLGSPVPSAPVVFGTDVIVANDAGTVYKIDTAAKQLTTLATLEETTIDGPVLLYDGIIYIQNSKYELVRIDASSGAQLTAVPLVS
jgi:outer membrane protein assembly factor BamB